MLLTNHTLTGIALGLTIDDIAVLVPVGVASHLILDMTPHFGYKTDGPEWARHPKFLIIGGIDFTISALLTVGACILWPERLAQIIVGVIGADLPDLTYIPLTLFGRRNVTKIPGYAVMLKFLARIQWYEKTPGLITEVIWMTIILSYIQGVTR